VRLSVPSGEAPYDEWIAAAIAMTIVYVVVVVVRSTARFFLRRRSAATAGGHLILELASHTHPALFIMPTVYVTSLKLQLDHRIWLLIGAEVSVIAQTTFWVTGAIHWTLLRFEKSRDIDPNAAMTFRIWRVVAIVVVWIVAVIIALSTAGVDVRTLLTGLGIGGVAIALATQNILSEALASLSILIEKTFVVGDTIQVGDDIGVVDGIGLRTTRVRALSGESLTFSNSALLKSPIHNLGRGTQRRVVHRVRVDYATPAATVAMIPKLLQEAVESRSHVRFDRAHLTNFVPIGYDFELVYFVESRDVRVWMDIQQAVLLAITNALAAADVTLASAVDRREAFEHAASAAE
jgi:small-conductance mechanosensitive channel